MHSHPQIFETCLPILRRAMLCALFAGLVSCGRKKEALPPAEPPTGQEPTSVIPPPQPTPIPTLPRKPLPVAQLFQGITYANTLATTPTKELASAERVNPASYVVEIKVSVKKPRPAATLDDFRANDAYLAEILGAIPGFPDGAKVSPAFEKFYDLKEKWLRNQLGRLDQLLSRHNYYDCETILEFSAPGTGRKVLVFKGDMDVNTDGSDGDRNIAVDASSPFFQPQTSYRWKKRTERVNPFLERTENRLAELKAEYAIKGLTPQRNAELKAGIEKLSRRAYDLKTWSFLAAATDPSIVLPGFLLRGSEEGPPLAAIGDYAVVFYNGKACPAIVGDAGPSFKFGEASLRLCKELNEKSSAIGRPVSELKVGYLVFPGTADEPGPPDLARWRERCQTLLAEIGLTSVNLHVWEDLVKPWPTPTPVPTPTPEAPALPEAPAPSETPETPVPVETPADSPAPVPEVSPPSPVPDAPEDSL